MSVTHPSQPTHTSNATALPQHVPYIEVVSLVRDDADGILYAKIHFDDVDGRRLTLLKPWSALDKSGLLLNELKDRGYALPDDQEGRAVLKGYFASARPAKRQQFVHRMGWTQDGAYTFPDGIIGDRQELWVFDSKLERTTTVQNGGSLEEWRRLIAAPAVHSAYLMFAIAVAFASMLLGPVGVKSGIFHLHGTSGSRSRSSIGKTLCLRVAISVFGPPNRLRHWDTTDTRLEELAAAFNDGLLSLDELAQASFDERETAKRVRHLAFMIEGESGRGRSLVYTGGKDAVSWRALVLSTGELGIAELAKQAVAKRLKGEEVRAIDVPVEADPKLGIFHSLPEGYRHSGKLVGEFEAHCRRYFGRPARAFAEGFAADREALIEQARRRMNWFQRKLRVPVEGWERRFAERFALAYAAARLAADLGILPWTQHQTFQAIAICYKAARGAIQDEGAMLQKVLARVRKSLAAEHQIVDLRSAAKPPSSKELRRARGFIKEASGSGVFYALKREAFERLVRPLPSDLVLRQLVRDGHLLTTRGRRSPWKQILVKGLNNAKQPYACLSKAFVTARSS